MLVELSRNYKKYEKGFYIYFVMSTILFLIFATDFSVIDRIITIACIVSFITISFSLYGRILRNASKRPSWKSRIKSVDRNLTFFFGFGCVIFLMSLLGIINGTSSFGSEIYLSGMGLAFIYATLKSKYKYIYKFDKSLDEL